MSKKLPARPNLDHLRCQAKSLLASLAEGDRDAIATLREHLPAAAGKSAEQIQQAGFRLAGAQSAIARKSGFASWPQLGRHVEQLRALEGTWAFHRLEVDGEVVPPAAVKASRLLIDGDRFRTVFPAHEGIFNIDVEADPHHIDLQFSEGPESGNTNYGIFRLDGDQLEICLDVNGKPRPTDFLSTSGSGHAYETLVRVSSQRPSEVAGGTSQTKSARVQPPMTCDPEGFDYVPSPTLERMQGEWIAIQLVKDGQPLPAAMLNMMRREATGNVMKTTAGGQMMIHARVRINETTMPMQIDFYHIDGISKGELQLGIMEWQGNEICSCYGAPGAQRPNDFTCLAGSGRTLSRWRPQPDK